MQVGTHAIQSESPTGRKVVLRALSKAELLRDYAALRLTALRDELGWAHSSPQTPDDVIDDYDSRALPYGVFDQGDLAGAIRLVWGDSIDMIPSASFIKRISTSQGTSAELSRAVVSPRYRRCGVFSALIAVCVHTARAAAISRVFVSIVDSRKGRELFSREGFRAIGEPFHYTDRTVAVSQPAILLSADFDSDNFNERTSLDRIAFLLETAALAIRRRHDVQPI
jgi:GNAT superfamily N-acetyltransferase